MSDRAAHTNKARSAKSSGGAGTPEYRREDFLPADCLLDGITPKMAEAGARVIENNLDEDGPRWPMSALLASEVFSAMEVVRASSHLELLAMATEKSEKDEVRLSSILKGAFAGPPTPLKDIPTKAGESRKLVRRKVKKTKKRKSA